MSPKTHDLSPPSHILDPRECIVDSNTVFMRPHLLTRCATSSSTSTFEAVAEHARQHDAVTAIFANASFANEAVIQGDKVP